jgi:type IV secretory pathway VirB9-like protein
MTYQRFLIRLLVGGALITDSLMGAEAAKRPATARLATPEEAPAPPAGARMVSYGERDVITIRTKVRYTTLIALPKTEQILDYTVGDKEFWVIEGNQNFAYVKPAKAGAQTNLNLVTAGGNIYSFVLTEISDQPKAEPDLKIFVDLSDEDMRASSQSAPRFVAAQEVESYKDKLAKAKDEIQQVKDAQQAAINQGISRFVSNVRFPYRFEAGRKPFFVRVMYHDDRFTYIQARPEETPTLYEIKDGQPNLVNFEYKDGVYVVTKILDRGYLAIGKQRLPFTREE